MKPMVLALSLIALAILGGCASLTSPHAYLFGERVCAAPSSSDAAAQANRASLDDPTWTPFGRPEHGWSVYALKAGREIGTHCAPTSPGFAARLAHWQAGRGLAPTGIMDVSTFQAMKARWQDARPFVSLRAKGVCPDPPGETTLAVVPALDAYDGKTVQLRPAALKALHRMLSAAETDVPAAARGPGRLAVFSAYRSPTYDTKRCAREGNCDGVGRAACSAHRTGLAVDIALGAAPGYAIDSSVDANRLSQTRSPAYRWLVDNAARFGFVNYVFEPWHWEWTGEAP